MSTNSERDNKLNSLDKRLDSLAGEVRFNENLLLRAEGVLSELVELNVDCKTRNDLQDERIVRMLEELQHNHNDIDKLRDSNVNQHAELKSMLREFEARSAERLERLEQRIQVLENWRWFILGAFGLAVLVIKYIPNLALIS